MPERDYLGAVRERVVVFDGGMGATLEQFDLTQEDYGGLEGKCHEALVLNRPDVIEGVHASMLEAGAEVLETDTFQGSRIKLDEWGLGEHTLEINRKAAEIARKAAGDRALRRRLDRPHGLPARERRPTLGDITFAKAGRGLRRAGAGPDRGRRRPDHRRDGAGHPRGEGGDLRRPRGVQAHRPDASRSRPRVSLLPQGGKMLLGTDIQAVLTTLTALDVQVIGLNCSTGPEDMRDAIRYLGETSPLPVHCIPNAGLPLQGPDGETIFPEEPEPLAATLGEFVERYGVGIVGGCCGTTPDHIAAIRERVEGRTPGERPEPGPVAGLSDDDRDPAGPGAAPDAGRRAGQLPGLAAAAKELLLADDYDGLVQVAEDQVTGGAHVLDLCVALTERQDEDEQMGKVASAISLTQPVADPGRLDRAGGDRGRAGADPRPGDRQLDQPRGRAGQARPRRPARQGSRRGADRPDDRRGGNGEDGRPQGRGRQADPRASAATSTASTPRR